MGDSVEVPVTAIVRAWKRGGAGRVAVQLKGGGPADLAAVAEAVRAANAAHPPEGRPGAGARVTRSPQGPLVLIGFCDTEAVLRSYLETLAAGLAQVGVTGSLAVPRSSSTPFDGDPVAGFALAALVPVDLTDAVADLRAGRGMPGWYGRPGPTEQLLALVPPWCAELPAVYLQLDGAQFRIDGADAGALTGDTLIGEANLVLSGVDGRTRLRSAYFSHLGELSAFTLGGPPGQDLADLVALLRSIAPHVEHGAVRTSVAQWDSWGNLVARPPAPRYAGPLRQVRHLLGRRVVDAYGVQILTDEHLAHAHDLSGWRIEPLGGGRHLVQAQDLDAWFGAGGPAPETVLRARKDFGALVLDPAVVADEAPTPW